MARTLSHEPESSYYPRRARWYSPIFYIGDALRRRLAINRVTLPCSMKASELVSGFLVPGLSVWLRGPKFWGNAAMAYSGILALVFLVWMGYPMANLAFGALISVHVTGFVYYCSPLLNSESFTYRIRFTFVTMFAMSLLLYYPARTFILGHWITPMRIHDQVMVVRLNSAPRHMHRGDWVAYALPESEEGPHGDVVVVHHGVGLGPVLGVAGDEVEFGQNTFSVNGISHTNLWRMPSSGGFTVPENCWFIWPDLGISGHGNVRESSIDSAVLQMSTVNQTQFVGAPFHHWLWRKQF